MRDSIGRQSFLRATVTRPGLLLPWLPLPEELTADLPPLLRGGALIDFLRSTKFRLCLEPIPPIVAMLPSTREEERVCAGGEIVVGWRGCQRCLCQVGAWDRGVAASADGRPIARLGLSGRSLIWHASHSSLLHCVDSYGGLGI